MSPYRLATHLTGAFAIYAAMFWTTLDVWFPNPSPDFSKSSASSSTPGPSRPFARIFPSLRRPFARRRRGPRRSRRLSGRRRARTSRGSTPGGRQHVPAHGRADRPGGVLGPGVFPDGGEVRGPPGAGNIGLDYDRVRLGARNFFENTAAVQFDHRVLAMSTLAATTATWLTTRNNARLPLPARHAAAATAAVARRGGAGGHRDRHAVHHVPVTLGRRTRPTRSRCSRACWGSCTRFACRGERRKGSSRDRRGRGVTV